MHANSFSKLRTVTNGHVYHYYFFCTPLVLDVFWSSMWPILICIFILLYNFVQCMENTMFFFLFVCQDYILSDISNMTLLPTRILDKLGGMGSM